MQQQLYSGFDPASFQESQKGVQDAAEAALAAIETRFEEQEKWAKSPEGKRALAHALLRRSIGAQSTDAAIGGAGGSLGTAFAMRDDFGRRIDEGAQFGQIIDRTESSRLTDDWKFYIRALADVIIVFDFRFGQCGACWDAPIDRFFSAINKTFFHDVGEET